MSAKVLVADDSCVMRMIIVMHLNSAGVSDVTEACDGEEAIRQFNQRPFDLVLTDWNMPKKTGLEVLQAIRAKDADVPVMMITTEADKRCVLAAIEAGVTDYLTKPFTSESLREKLQKHL
jgi:two-component system chemotaxis response regulator CheY